MGSKHTKSTRPLLLVFLAAVVLLAGTASAGWFDKPVPKSGGLLKNHRFNRHPSLTFTRGELHQGMRGEWFVGKRKIQLTKDCLIIGADGNKVDLAAGLQAIISGTVIGDMVFATEVRLIAPDWMAPPSLNHEGHKEASDSDPSVGVLKDSPM